MTNINTTANTITVWRREDANTAPRGLGRPVTYTIDEPHHSDAEMIWAEEIACTIPDGYTVNVAADGSHQLYDPNGYREEIVDDHGHPAIVTGIGRNRSGKDFARYERLDKRGQ